MDNDTLVAELQELASTLEQNEGPLALFMLLAPDAETNDAWNVIVSAYGYDLKSRGNAVRLFSEALRKTVDNTQLPRIARVTVLRTDDPFVRAMNTAFHAERSAMNLQSCNVYGIELPKAVLLESKRVAA